MVKDWTSPIYGFSQARPTIVEIDGCPCHEFHCAAPTCKGKSNRPRIIRRYLDKNDRNSTSNMHKHTKNCWGEEIVSKALEGKGELSIEDVRKGLSLAKLHDGLITVSFERKEKGSVTFSTRQHTYTETRSVVILTNPKKKKTYYLHSRVECVRWVAESMISMKTIDDPGFHRLMKTGRPRYRIPSSRTVARDVHVVFQ